MWDDEDNNPYGSFERRDSDQASSPIAGMALDVVRFVWIGNHPVNVILQPTIARSHRPLATSPHTMIRPSSYRSLTTTATSNTTMSTAVIARLSPRRVGMTVVLSRYCTRIRICPSSSRMRGRTAKAEAATLRTPSEQETLRFAGVTQISLHYDRLS
jgi:hypothetical protein